MSDQRATLEIIAPTIEEAIERGAKELGLRASELDVEVLDEGGRGVLGIGARQARVRLTVKEEGVEDESQAKSGGTSMATDESSENSLSIARETVSELLEKMGIRAEVEATMGESDDSSYQAPIKVDILGKDLSILIGRRAETLDALQFITRIIVGKEIGHSAHLIVDVEGYRGRREASLRQLAQRMADQASKSGRRQTLEPMPSNERRIIHMELQNSPDVTTESVGQDPRRKVTIIPVED